MPGTIEQLKKWEEHLGASLKATEGARTDDVRQAAFAAQREMRKLLPESMNDNVLNALRSAHRGKFSFPTSGSADPYFHDFFKNRYPWLLEGNDYESTCSWRAVLILLATQSMGVRTLLTGAGKQPNETMQTTISVAFRPLVKAPPAKMAERTKERELAADMVLCNQNSLRAALSMPAIAADRAAVIARLRKLTDGVFLGMGDGGALKGVLGLERIPVTEPKDPGWPTELEVGGQKTAVPSRAFSRLPSGRVEIREFGWDTSLNTTVPTRAVETILRQHPDDLLSVHLH